MYFPAPCADSHNKNSKEDTVIGNGDETINHLLNEFSRLTQKEYKCRNKCIGKRVYWTVSQVYEFKENEKSYGHKPSDVIMYDITN